MWKNSGVPQLIEFNKNNKYLQCKNVHEKYFVLKH